jgi:hypothetical protein
MGWFEHGNSRIYFEDRGSGDPLLMIPGITQNRRIKGPRAPAISSANREGARA